jgi:hypothetical protein
MNTLRETVALSTVAFLAGMAVVVFVSHSNRDTSLPRPGSIRYNVDMGTSDRDYPTPPFRASKPNAP